MRCIIELQLNLCKFKPKGEFDQRRTNIQEAFFCLKKVRDLLEFSTWYEPYELHCLVKAYKKRSDKALKNIKFE